MPIEVEADHFAEQHFNILVSRQNLADGCRDFGRRKSCRRHLVEQWLEGMVVLPVDQSYLYREPRQCLGCLESAEPTADDDHPGAFFFDFRDHSHSMSRVQRGSKPKAETKPVPPKLGTRKNYPAG